MKIEIVKDSIEDGQIVYSIRKKIFGFIPIYKSYFPFDKEPTLNKVLCLLATVASFILTIVLSSIFFMEKVSGFDFIYILGMDILTFFYYKYSFRILCNKISDAEYEVREYFKTKSFNKEIVQTYDIQKNKIIVEKNS